MEGRQPPTGKLQVLRSDVNLDFSVLKSQTCRLLFLPMLLWEFSSLYKQPED